MYRCSVPAGTGAGSQKQKPTHLESSAVATVYTLSELFLLKSTSLLPYSTASKLAHFHSTNPGSAMHSAQSTQK